MNNNKTYIFPQITEITIDSQISLQMESESHTKTTPPEEPGWETQFNQSTSVQPYQDVPMNAPINDNLDLLN